MARKRQLGPSLSVSPIGFGCMGMSDFYGTHDDGQSAAVLEMAVEHGVDLFDTADTYGFGHNETLLAPLLARHRGLKVSTKFGIVRQPGAYERRIDNSPAYIRQACEASLRRLGVETIDLYLVHRLEAERPVEETVGTLAELVREGKVRTIGLCEASAATIRRAHAVHPLAAVQSEYSLWTRDPEADGVLDACRELGIGFMAYSPIGRGFLSGALTDGGQLEAGDMRRALPRFSGDNLARNRALVERLTAFAARKGCTPAQLSLAWLLHREPFVVPIPGMRRAPHLAENLAAAEVTLTAADMAWLDETLPVGAAAGERYTAEGMKGVGV